MTKTFCALACMLFSLAACCDQKSVPKATQLLYSSNPTDRNEAALKLARCGDAAAKAVPRLSELLYDENVGVQSSAAYALRRIDTKGARAALERATKKKKK